MRMFCSIPRLGLSLHEPAIRDDEEAGILREARHLLLRAEPILQFAAGRAATRRKQKKGFPANQSLKKVR